MIFVISSGMDFKRGPTTGAPSSSSHWDNIQGGTIGSSHGMSWLDVGGRKGGGVDTYKYYIWNKFSQPIRPILEWGVGGWTDGVDGASFGWMDIGPLAGLYRAGRSTPLETWWARRPPPLPLTCSPSLHLRLV
jgi:hypothetical protein